MKKTFVLTLAALTLSAASFAWPHEEKAKDAKKPAAKTEIQCAVMKDHKVNIKEATAKKMFADYKGHRYFFCCGGCPGQFKKDPVKFAKAPSIPTPKHSKPKKS